MPNPIVTVKKWSDDEGHHGTHLYFWCPGCDQLHGAEIEEVSKKWQWNGSLESPTLTPSILTHSKGRDDPRKCHAFITDGQWRYCDDCFHDLVGRTVNMVPLPIWMLH